MKTHGLLLAGIARFSAPARAGAGRRRRRDFLDAKRVLGVLGKRLARYGRFHRDHAGTARVGWMEQETHLLGPCRKLPTMPRACRLIDICSTKPPSYRRWMISISRQS